MNQRKRRVNSMGDKLEVSNAGSRKTAGSTPVSSSKQDADISAAEVAREERGSHARQEARERAFSKWEV